MTVPYDFESSASHYKNHYSNQSGGKINVFRGKTTQYGSGIGGVFSKIFRGIAPVLKQVAKSGGRELLKAGSKIAADVLDKKSFSQSVKKNLSSSGKNMLHALSSSIGPKVGGTKRKARTNKKMINSRPHKKKRRHLNNDIFA